MKGGLYWSACSQVAFRGLNCELKYFYKENKFIGDVMLRGTSSKTLLQTMSGQKHFTSDIISSIICIT